MAIYKFPGSDDSKSHEGQKSHLEKEERKLPEFIVIEEEQQEKFSGDSAFEEKFKKMSTIRVPLRLRLFCLSMGILAVFVSVGALICYCTLTLLCVLTFYRVNTLNALANKFWRQLKRSSVFALGLILSVFSPYLGFGLVLMYFMLHHEILGQSPFARMMRQNLSDFFDPRS